MALAIALPGAAQAAVTLQPGAYMETDVGSCTLNFEYTGGGKTYQGRPARLPGHAADGVSSAAT